MGVRIVIFFCKGNENLFNILAMRKYKSHTSARKIDFEFLYAFVRSIGTGWGV